jgi:hypothetical protein
MPTAVLMEIPGVTQEQYDRAMEALELDGMPEGGILHIAAPMEGGWRVLDVWESQEQFERFYQDKLAAALTKAGIPQDHPPKYQEIYNVMSREYARTPA